MRKGVICTVAAFAIWGLFPLYWKQLSAIPAVEVVAHRTFWGFVSVALWITFYRRWRDVRQAVTSGRTILILAGSACLIATNWLLYIWAVAAGHVIEASLGYYINPLVSVLLGVMVLRERLGPMQLAAVALAGAGVMVLTFGYGRFPWIALTLAFSFAFYGLARKRVAADAVTGLLVETAILTPLAGGYLTILALQGRGGFGHSNSSLAINTLLVLAGAVTAVPLALFAFGARRLPLSTVGFLQYLSPSLQFLIAVFVYHEPFTAAHGVTFACIWLALALLTLDLRVRMRVAPEVTELQG